MKRQHYKEDAIIKIPLDGGLWSFARLLRFPQIAFFAIRNESGTITWAELLQSKVLFTIAVHKSAVSSGRWEKIGKFPTNAPRFQVPEKFMQNIGDPYDLSIVDEHGRTRPATFEECRGLERSAVWEADHVEERLNDHFAGEPNIAMMYFRLKEPPFDVN